MKNVKMKKIMFNDKYCLTQAVLAGKKTMTRRILKGGTPLGAWKETRKHLPYKVGDVLAIAQSYNDIFDELEQKYGKAQANEWWCNALDSVGGGLDTSAGYKNKMFVRADFMIHRIRFINVRLERLQDISDEECLREGIKQVNFIHYAFENSSLLYLYPREAFAELIDKVCGKGTWENNPFVAAYSFELVD